VLGMLNTKNPTEFANFLLPKTASAQAIAIPDQPLSLTADELAGALNIPAAQSLNEAIQQVAATEAKPARVLITGSLYLMGYILSH
jgi:dihydrofolate synthase/folylpolyglutamate synthase